MKVLLIDGFPAPHAIVEVAGSTLGVAGHDVTKLPLIEAGFGAFMSADERRAVLDRIDNRKAEYD